MIWEQKKETRIIAHFLTGESTEVDSNNIQDEGWYFGDETGDSIGPYKSQSEAEKAQEAYALELSKERPRE